MKKRGAKQEVLARDSIEYGPYAYTGSAIMKCFKTSTKFIIYIGVLACIVAACIATLIFIRNEMAYHQTHTQDRQCHPWHRNTVRED